MKKHLLVCLLALVLASLCMLPSQVQAAEETHYHCACGADHVSIDGHTTDSSSNWKPLPFDENGNVQWPTAGNRYYLTRDVVIDKTWVVEMTNAPIVLCLNGHNITMEVSGPAIEVNGTDAGKKASLTITDCKGEGKITHKDSAKGPAVQVCGFGSFTMYGGTITGNHVNGSGGGVYIDGGSSKFTMYGGSITKNSATGSGGGVYVDGERSSFIMYGGTITNNSATGSGGGVYVGKETKTYVWVGGNAQIAGNTADTNKNSGIYFSDNKQRLSVQNKLITDARIVIDNEAPESYITSGSNGNYAIDTTNGVLTAPSHKPHYLCGSSDNTKCTFGACATAGKVDFKQWNSDNSLPTSGNYYLTKNVKLSTGQTITGDVTLCLNGYKIEAASGVEPIILNNGGTLTITDCVGSGSIVGVNKQQTGVIIQKKDTLNLYGGTIRNFTKGVVNNGTFNMYGGKLTKNSQGVSNTNTFNMHGGTITENSGASNGAGVSNSGSFTMSGGDITYNTASQSGTENNGFGGGVHNRSSFVMTDGTITGNTAKNDGGGVYSGSDSTYIYGGSITSNNAKRGDDVYAASNCGVHLKGNVTIGSYRSNGLLTNTVHYIDGSLEADSESKILLSVASGTTNDTVLLSPGKNYTIKDADLKKFSLKNGYEVTLNDKGNVILSLPHKHTLCNGTSWQHSGAGHSDSCGTSVTFEEWTDAEAKKMYPDTGATAANCLPNEGDWYLTNPVTLTAPHVVDGGELNLCLNGNNVTLDAEGAVFSVKNGGELNLADCKGTGIITHTESKNGAGVSVEAGSDGTTAGTFNLYNGKITGNSNSDNGGGVSVFRDGQFNMYGGTITNNKAATGGGVYVADHATVTIGGGSITNNEAAEGGGMTVGNCQVTLSGKVTITGNKSAGETSSNLYIKGGKGVTIDSSFASGSQVVFKDCEGKYDGTYYISNADDLKSNQLTCFTTDAGRKFVKAKDNKIYVAMVLDKTQKPTVQEDLVYNGEEQTGVNIPPNTDKFYTIDGTTQATQANAAYAQDSEYRSGYTAKVELEPGYALYHSNTYYVAGIPLNLVWRIAQKEAAADDFVVTDSTLTTTYDEKCHGVTVTVAEQYTKNGENWDGKLEVQYKAEGGKWTNAKPTDAGTYQLQVRIANGANFAASVVDLSESLTIKPASKDAPDRNTFKVTAPTSINGEDGQITGVTTEMEYRTEDGQKWEQCPNGTIIGSDGNYQIRYAATPNHDASPAIEVTIPPHVHDFCEEIVEDKYSAAPATCTEAATYYKSCACGTSSGGTADPVTFTNGDPLGHKYELKALDSTHHAMHCTNGCDGWKMETKAAHSYDGLEGTECRDCGYVRTVGHYTVSIAVERVGFGTVSANVVDNVPEGASITVNGGELTIHSTTDTTVTATASTNTPQYTYTFTGWTIDGQPIPENYTINETVAIKANFNRVANQYTVTWNAAGGTIQDTVYTSGKQDWGTQITAPSNVVKAPDSSFSYAFTGWKDADGNDPAATVTGNVTYTAQYTKVAHVYEAGVWKYDDSGHWHVCTVLGCGYAAEKTPHTYADADATVCKDCGAPRTLPKLTGMVEISGELAKGERLTVVATDLPSTATQLRYQWLRNDTIITGANDMDYTLTAEDVGAKISVNVTAVGHTGSLYAIAAGQVDVIYTVSYDTNGGTIGSLRQDRVKFGADYTLPECDFITAPDKKTFDQWEIDGVSYKAGTTYRVMNDVTVMALWKDAGSDRPAPTPSRPSHRGSTIEAISTADGRSATDYSGGIYGLTFRSTASFSSFLGVQVDGGTIAPSCYSAEEGSIVVYLKAVYLRTLKAGTHTITILSSEGNASMEFTVGGVTTSPKTFDAGVAGYVSIALLGLTGGSLCLRRKKDGNA